MPILGTYHSWSRLTPTHVCNHNFITQKFHNFPNSNAHSALCAVVITPGTQVFPCDLILNQIMASTTKLNLGHQRRSNNYQAVTMTGLWYHLVTPRPHYRGHCNPWLPLRPIAKDGYALPIKDIKIIWAPWVGSRLRRLRLSRIREYNT